jgi:TolB-like protein
MTETAPKHRKSWQWLAVLAMMIVPGIVSLLYLRSAPRKPIDSLAVLPFTYPADDSEAASLSEQITLYLNLGLPQILGLRVAPRETIPQDPGDTRTAQEIGHQLGVRAIVRGRIERRTHGILISVELLDSGDSGLLWSRQYNLSGEDDVAAFEQEITQDLAGFLHY